MKKTLGLILGIVVAASTAFATNAEKTSSYEIDTKESKVIWTAGKITGAKHTGYILIANGTIEVKGKSISSANLNIDLNTIVNTDIENEEYNKKLVGHLKSDDFFSVEKHPLANFEITSVKKANGSEYRVVGNLSIKGITNEISFPAKINISGGKVTAYGTASIDRTKWDIKYGSASFFKGLGDKTINNEFEIKFELSAKESSSTAKI
jgi:polyisoprenoid-binding protein YceI